VLTWINPLPGLFSIWRPHAEAPDEGRLPQLPRPTRDPDIRTTRRD